MVKINLKQIFLWSQEEPELVSKFRDFGAIPKEGEVKCSTCKKPMHLWFDKNEKEWYWRCQGKYIGHARKRKNCNGKKSVKSVSIFEGSHLSFEQFMIFIHEWCHFSEVRKMALEANIGSSATAAVYNKLCTEIVIHTCFTNSVAIGE